MIISFHTMRGTINLLSLRPEDMMAEIFADALAKQNRYGGRTPEPWSVASHSMLVEALCPPEYRPWALLPDANSVFMGEFMTPSVDLLVHTDGIATLPDAVAMTKGRVDRQIAAAWGTAVLSRAATVRQADHIAYLAEIRTFMGIRPDLPLNPAGAALAAPLPRSVQRGAGRLNSHRRELCRTIFLNPTSSPLLPPMPA
ncbi:hypothetical protein [Paracoccus sp. IB05]|uniref:hypothetical protein n=1 Tax=Paracoccus sp. IB05 TaxID=2779367 RepID=UPI0018E8DEE8|nr:hypothetical protein [Paracoccus sp. IB05]MBJ2152867.1 hypothetical protein [Paracoccus sp. IB05]